MTAVDDMEDVEYEITTGEGIDQGGEATGDGGDFAYPLTAFIPRATSPADAKQVPQEATTWIIPDINNIKYYRIRRMFKLTWRETVPPGYRFLFVRTVNRKPEPTPWQAALINASIGKYDEQGKDKRLEQLVLMPIIRITEEGELVSAVAEMGVDGHKKLRAALDTVESATEGLVSTSSHAFRIWRKQGEKGVVEVRHVKGAKYDVAALVEEYPLLDLNEYAKTRAIATEEWFLSEWQAYKSGGRPSATGGVSREERLSQAMEHIPTPRLKALLKAADVEVSSSSRVRLFEAALDNIDSVEGAILTVSAQFEETAADKAAETQGEVPF